MLLLLSGCGDSDSAVGSSDDTTSSDAVVDFTEPPCVDRDKDGIYGLTETCPGGTDCNDTNVTVFPGAPEICGDGIDQDCAGDILADFDQDGDGFASSVHANLDGDFGADCLDDLDGQTLPVEDSFLWGIEGAGLSNEEVLDHYGLTPFDFRPGTADDFYDGFDLNCDMVNDCDQDGDGWDAYDEKITGHDDQDPDDMPTQEEVDAAWAEM